MDVHSSLSDFERAKHVLRFSLKYDEIKLKIPVKR